MAKDKDGKDGKGSDKAAAALRGWREAEAAYVRASARFLIEDGSPGPLRKDDLIELVRLREKADRAREQYFKRQDR